MASEAELTAMRRAIELAALGAGRTNPNPNVGAVILSSTGEILGEGWHRQAGGPHAEIEALAAAGAASSGATIVVTLEPCSHTGRTGPCSEAIIAAGIARVIFAVGDPNTPAAGGARRLRDAGIDVESGVLAAEAAELIAPWLTAVSRRRPHVTWKYAATLDGRTAAADGTSRWITGAAARADVHRERALADAVVVGIGTILADDTRLTVRDYDSPRQPLRVVVDGKARTPASARILEAEAPTVIAVGEDAAPDRVNSLQSAGAEVIQLPRRGGRIDLSALLAALHEREVHQVLVEGGATLAASFVRAGLVDRVVGFHAPALLGSGPPVLGDAGISTIADALRLNVVSVTRLGDDVRIESRVAGRTN